MNDRCFFQCASSHRLTAFILINKQGCFFNTLDAYFEAMNLAEAITKRIRQHRQPWVFTPKDFLDLGTPHAVGMTLERVWKRPDFYFNIKVVQI